MKDMIRNLNDYLNDKFSCGTQILVGVVIFMALRNGYSSYTKFVPNPLANPINWVWSAGMLFVSFFVFSRLQKWLSR